MDIEEYELYFPHYNTTNEERLLLVLDNKFEEVITWDPDIKKIYKVIANFLIDISKLTKDPDIFLCNIKPVLDKTKHTNFKGETQFSISTIIGSPFTDVSFVIEFYRDLDTFDLGFTSYVSDEENHGEGKKVEVKKYSIKEKYFFISKDEFEDLISDNKPYILEELNEFLTERINNERAVLDLLAELYQTELK